MFGHTARIKLHLEAEGWSLVKNEKEMSWELVNDGDVYLSAFRMGDLLKMCEKEFQINL